MSSYLVKLFNNCNLTRNCPQHLIAYTLLVYVFHELCSVILFFSGKNFNNDDAETFELLEVKEEYAKKQEQKAAQPVFTYVVQQPPGVQVVQVDQKEGEQDA